MGGGLHGGGLRGRDVLGTFEVVFLFFFCEIAWEIVCARLTLGVPGRCSYTHGVVDGPRAPPYLTLDCVANAVAVLANRQPTNALLHCALDLSNASLWARLDVPRSPLLSSVLQVLRALIFVWPAYFRIPPPLLPPVALLQVEEGLEDALRRHIAIYRQEQHLETHFDRDLSFLLSPALAAYEWERLQVIIAVVW